MAIQTPDTTLQDADIVVEVQVAADVDDIPANEFVQSWVASTIRDQRVIQPCEVSVRIVDRTESRALNKQFRDKDQPTNVLSFAAESAEFSVIEGELDLLGDIVICAPLVEQEAAEQHKAVADHWAHLLVHGTLHLLGYDHESDVEAEEMESIERRILASRGLRDPYRCNEAQIAES